MTISDATDSDELFREASTVSRETFIKAMRGIAHSVSVVTTDGPAGRFGATVSAFSSVSADPPTILVCLRAESRIARAVSENGTLCINVLSQNNPEIAERFAGNDDGYVSDRFAGVSCSCEHDLPPEIDNAIAFSCKVAEVLASGSHLIVIGNVIKVRPGRETPLIYLDGAYQRVGLQNKG